MGNLGQVVVKNQELPLLQCVQTFEKFHRIEAAKDDSGSTGFLYSHRDPAASLWTDGRPWSLVRVPDDNADTRDGKSVWAAARLGLQKTEPRRQGESPRASAQETASDTGSRGRGLLRSPAQGSSTLLASHLRTLSGGCSSLCVHVTSEQRQEGHGGRSSDQPLPRHPLPAHPPSLFFLRPPPPPPLLCVREFRSPPFSPTFFFPFLPYAGACQTRARTRTRSRTPGGGRSSSSSCLCQSLAWPVRPPRLSL